MRFCWLIALFLCPLFLIAQQPDTSQRSQFAPEFPGGEQALLAYLKDRLNPPPRNLCGGKGGESLLSFIIEKDGSVSTVEVVKSLCPAFDSIAVRIVAEMPRWKPGSSDGNPVRVQYTLPLRYRSETVAGSWIGAPPFWTNWRFGAGIGLSGGTTLNTGGFGKNVGPVMGSFDLTSRFGSERLAMDLDIIGAFSRLRQSFVTQGQPWEKDRSAFLVSVSYGLRQRVWRSERRDLAIQGGVMFHILGTSSTPTPDMLSPRLEKTAPWLGATFSWRLREKKQPDAMVVHNHLYVQAKWSPLFYPQPLRGSFFMLAVGLDFLAMTTRAAAR